MPQQYELASLRSLNTENQERLLGQARTIADARTNHHAKNIIMIRLQAKREQYTWAQAAEDLRDSAPVSIKNTCKFVSSGSLPSGPCQTEMHGDAIRS